MSLVAGGLQSGGGTASGLGPGATGTTLVLSGASTALQFISTQASGSDGFKANTSGARWHVGAGASDYFSSDGTTVTFACPVAVSSITNNNGGAAGNLPIVGTMNLTTGKPLYFVAGLNVYVYGTTAGNILIPSSIADGWELMLGGVANCQYTPVGNVGAGEDDLMTTTIPASSVTTTGRGVHYAWSGAVANSINAKTLKLYFGSSFISVVIPVSTAGFWFADARIIRTGLNTQRYTVLVTVTATATNAVSGIFSAQGTLAETETATIVAKATATATTDNDLTQTTAVTEFF